jgi:hypothetical protein
VEEKDTLARVGRNLANFQTLEHLLKELLPTLQMQGTVTQIARSLEENKKRVRKSSLGELSDEFHSSLFAPVATVEPSGPLTEPHFAFAIRVESTPERIRAVKARWRRLVAQRNRLVHSQLLEFDLSKREDCIRLSELLDAQNGEVCAMLDELALLRSHRASAAMALAEHVQSGKWLDENLRDDA